MNAADFDIPWLRGSPAETYARFARDLATLCAAGGASAASAGDATWIDACRRFGAGQFTAAGAPFGANAAAAESAAAFARAADAPPLGATREYALRWQAWARGARDFVAATEAFAVVLGEIGGVAGERYARRLAAPDAATAPLRVLFDDWIDCAETAWQDAAHGERFCDAQARVVGTFIAWRAAAQTIAADVARAADVPTRGEVDELQRAVRELQRELAATKRDTAKRSPTKRSDAPARRRRRTPR